MGMYAAQVFESKFRMPIPAPLAALGVSNPSPSMLISILKPIFSLTVQESSVQGRSHAFLAGIEVCSASPSLVRLLLHKDRSLTVKILMEL